MTYIVQRQNRFYVAALDMAVERRLVTHTGGRFLNPESVSQLFDRIVGRSELPRIRFHDLGHTDASLLVAADVRIKVVSERIGHVHPRSRCTPTSTYSRA